MNTKGTFVVDGVVGDYLCSKYGDLRDSPLTIQVGDNRIVDLRSENKELLEDFRAYTGTDENSNRVGEFAIGTSAFIGNLSLLSRSSAIGPRRRILPSLSGRSSPITS